MKNVSCQIIEDLLPLYVDEACSEDSRDLIEEHLKECESCQKKLDEMSAPVPALYESIENELKETNTYIMSFFKDIYPPEESYWENAKDQFQETNDFAKNLARKWKFAKYRWAILALLFGIVFSFLIILIGDCNFIPVSSDAVMVKDLHEDGHGKVDFSLVSKEGEYVFGNIEMNSDVHGDKVILYLLPKRPLFADKASSYEEGMPLQFETDDLYQIRVGNLSSSKVIWEDN